jgi:isoleucyl-tRNA synthetase
MQSVIENGRLIRERKTISLKIPLQSVTLIDQDEEALKDLKLVEVYILDELNCLELKTLFNEDDFVEYKCEPDHMLMGQALKKKFDKKFKMEILKLPSSWLRDYLKNGFGMIGEIKIEENWLKVDKLFNEKMK